LRNGIIHAFVILDLSKSIFSIFCHYAASTGCAAMVSMLVAEGFEMNDPDTFGETPNDVALRCQSNGVELSGDLSDSE
jgi:hypothetical protein